VQTRELSTNANGVFVADTNTVYLSDRYIAENAVNIDAITGVVLEEYAHAIDFLINTTDSPGDEGAIFAASVQGQTLDATKLARLKAEDDTAVITLDGKDTVIEQSVVTLKPSNFLDQAIRHRNYLGFISPIGNELDKADSTFKMVQGLADPNGVSFESVNYPGNYMRHEGYRIKLSAGNDPSFKADATFYKKTGLADPNQSSFESSNFPGYFVRHKNSELFIDPNNGSDLFKKDSTFKSENPPVTLWASNYPDRAIRHRNSLGEITPISNNLDIQDASFRIVQGLANSNDPNAISFESVNYPGNYLKHEGYRIKLAAGNDQLFKADATFYMEHGLSNSSQVSFESSNFPNYFIRHKNGQLLIDFNDSSTLFTQDSTFNMSIPSTTQAISLSPVMTLQEFNNWRNLPEYFSRNPFPSKGQNCTWYAHGRMMQLGFSEYALDSMLGNAKDWDNTAGRGSSVSSAPQVGSIALWEPGSSGVPFPGNGHVAVVERVNNDGTILISESNWANQTYGTRTISRNVPSKFIIVPRA